MVPENLYYCAKCVLGHRKIDKARKPVRGKVREWVTLLNDMKPGAILQLFNN